MISKVGLFQCLRKKQITAAYCIQLESEANRSRLRFFVRASAAFLSAESPQAGGQLCTRRESLTQMHRMLTHLGHLYRKRLKN